MKTRDDFLAEFEDELRGMLEHALAEAERLMPSRIERDHISYAALGMEQVKRWKRARRFLERVYDSLAAPTLVEKPATKAHANGATIPLRKTT